jgi:hypothetical protein
MVQLPRQPILASEQHRFGSSAARLFFPLAKNQVGKNISIRLYVCEGGARSPNRSDFIFDPLSPL